MILYTILPFIVLFLAPSINVRIVIGDRSRQKKQLFWVLFAFMVMLIFIYGFRDSGGADDAVYRLYYERDYGGSFLDFFEASKEPVFNAIKALGYALGLNYKGLYLGYAIVTIYFLIAGLKNYYEIKTDVTLYIAAFLFVAFPAVMTVMRQAAAMAMLFYLYSIRKPTWKQRIVIWFLILCTHYGFAILLPVEIIISCIKYRLSTPIKILVPLGCLVIGQTVNLNEVIRAITSILGLYNYMNDDANYTDAAGLGIVTFGLFALYIFKLLYRRCKCNQFTDEQYQQTNGADFAQMMYFSLLLLTVNLRWANRLGMFYTFMVPQIIVECFDLLPVRKGRQLLFYIALVLLYVLFIVYMQGIFGQDGYQWSLDFVG